MAGSEGLPNALEPPRELLPIRVVQWAAVALPGRRHHGRFVGPPARGGVGHPAGASEFAACSGRLASRSLHATGCWWGRAPTASDCNAGEQCGLAAAGVARMVGAGDRPDPVSARLLAGLQRPQTHRGPVPDRERGERKQIVVGVLEMAATPGTARGAAPRPGSNCAVTCLPAQLVDE